MGNRQAVSSALNAAGVACRVEGYNHQTRSDWKVVTDASLHGRECGELVSPPMKYNDASFQIIEKVGAALAAAGATVNRQCGLHVHHDAGDFRGQDFARLVADYSDNRNLIDSFMPQSRHTNASSWCRNPSRSVRNCTSASAVRTRCGTRYMAVNVSAFFVHGTVEFRQHAGTIDATKILNWVHLTHAMMEKARAGEDMNRCTNLESFLDSLSTTNRTATVRDIRLSVRGIGGLAYRLIEQGYDNADVLRMILESNPEASTSIDCIKWYRSRWNRAQRQNGNTETATTSRALLSSSVKAFFISRRDHFAVRETTRRVA
jgi:hypothetical protein